MEDGNMPTLTELHDNPRLMAEFFGWSFEKDEVVEHETGGSWPHTYLTTKYRPRTAEEATIERYQNQKDQSHHAEIEYNHKHNPPQTHDNYVRQCAREVFGIKGRTADGVRRKCAEAHPELYSLDPDIEPTGHVQGVTPTVTPLPPKRMCS